MKYILNDQGEVEACSDVLEWAKWMATHDPTIARDHVTDQVRVSTVFTGFDYGWGLGGAPVLFETMIFGGPYDRWQDRYTSKEAALEGHADAVTRARAGWLP